MSVWQNNNIETIVVSVQTEIQSVLQVNAVDVTASANVYIDNNAGYEASVINGDSWIAYSDLAPIATITDEYIHLSGGSVWVQEGAAASLWGVLPQSLCKMVSTYVTYVDRQLMGLEHAIIETETIICVDNMISTGDRENRRSGVQSELYFRVVAGRPCQIALGAATRKRIQSVSPKLPAALHISSDGYYITGTPVVTGTHSLAVTADDGSQLSLVIEVVPISIIYK